MSFRTVRNSQKNLKVLIYSHKQRGSGEAESVISVALYRKLRT